jgi:hypothetical protein
MKQAVCKLKTNLSAFVGSLMIDVVVNLLPQLGETIADNLSKAGWTWGCISAVDSSGANNLCC